MGIASWEQYPVGAKRENIFIVSSQELERKKERPGGVKLT